MLAKSLPRALITRFDRLAGIVPPVPSRPGRSRATRVRFREALVAVPLFSVLASCSPAPRETHSDTRRASATATSSTTVTATVPTATLGSDPVAVRRLAEVEVELSKLRSCSPACLATLEEYRLRFGNDKRVVALLRAAYQRLEDWEALVELEEELPGTASTAAERAQLASVYHRAGRYREAASQLEDLLAEYPEDADLARQSAIVLFELGEYDDALERLDRTAGRLSGAQAAEAETLRGLVSFYRQDLVRAEDHFSRALELDADSVSALSSFARVLAARQQPDRALELLERADELRQANLIETRRVMRLSAMSRLTSDACVARSWDSCERLIREMLAAANRSEQIGIYRYLAEILTLAGRPREAKEAIERSEELAVGTGRP